jgi:hypothetical protein
MSVIRFTAESRGFLPSWLAAGRTFYLANNFNAFPLKISAKREREETLDGTPEGYLHALQSEYSITTDFIPLHERPVWRAFFSSVLNSETFAIDFDARQRLGNPGFEGGNTSSWEVQAGGGSFAVNSNAGLQALGSYAGQVTLQINANTTVLLNPAFANSIVVTPGQSVLLQGLAKRDESSLPNRNLNLTPLMLNAGGGSLYSTAVGTALSSVTGYQLVNGTATVVALGVRLHADWFKSTPAATDEAGRWLVDEHLLAILSSWTDVSLVDESVDEQQIGGVGVRYRFRVKVVP